MDEHLLISLVKNNPCLYDKNHTNYNDNFKKEDTWECIAHAMKVNKNACKSRWTTMRQQYAKEKRKHEIDMKSGIPEGRKKKGKFLIALSFLEKHVQGRRSKTSKSMPLSLCNETTMESDHGLEFQNIEDEEGELSFVKVESYSPEYTSSTNWESPSTSTFMPESKPEVQVTVSKPKEEQFPLQIIPARNSPSPTPAKRYKKATDDTLLTVGQTIQRIAEPKTNPSSENSNVDDLFAKYIAAELKTFRNLQNVNLAKQIIMKIIFTLKDEEDIKKGDIEFNLQSTYAET